MQANKDNMSKKDVALSCHKWTNWMNALDLWMGLVLLHLSANNHQGL